MTRDPTRIFLSGASADFAQVRLDLRGDLARGICHVIHQADFPQTAGDTVLKLAELIEPCGVVVHLIGRQTGSAANAKAVKEYLNFAERQEGGFLMNHPELRAALGDFSGITYTQWEAYIALHRGIALFVYADSTHNGATHPQRIHLDRLLLARKYPETYRDPAQLTRLILPDLMAYFRKVQGPVAAVPAALKPSNLPGGYIGRPFVGRDEFLEEIRESLMQKSRAAITQRGPAATGIAGLGGIGKTHAAIEYALLHQDDYSALLFATADTPEALWNSLARLCGVLRIDQGLPADEAIRAQAALDWLAANPGWLLIIDNVDDDTAAREIIDLLGKLSAGHVLITSRLREWADNVEPLDLGVLTPEAAAELLLGLTKRSRLKTSEDETLALSIVRMLGCLPLAIHQAAGYIGEHARTLDACIRQYEEEEANLLQWFSNLKIPLERPDKTAPRSVWITWKFSFEQLTEEERGWLLVFSHFSSEPIPDSILEADEAATPEWKAKLREGRAAIARAEKYCLLTRSQEEPVFKIHRLVQTITRLQASEDEKNAAARMAISLLHEADLGQPSDIRTWLKWNPLQAHAVSICNQSSENPPTENLGWLLNQIGSLLHAKGLYGEEERYRRDALRIDRAAYGPEHPEVAIRLNNLAQLLHNTKRFDEAEPLMREALRIDRAVHGDEHPKVAIRLNNLAVLLKDTQRFDEAEPPMREALRIDLAAATGDDDPTVARDLSNLGLLLRQSKRFDEAEPLIREALRIFEANFGPEHPSVAVQRNNLGLLFKDTQRFAEAEPMMREAVRIFHLHFGPEHPHTKQLSKNLDELFEPKMVIPAASESLVAPTTPAPPNPSERNPKPFLYDVFLSHNRADKARVHKLADRLETQGVKVWVDSQRIQAGELIPLKVEEGIRNSRVLMLCISPESLASGWVELEYSAAIYRDPANRQRRFIPLLLGKCELRKPCGATRASTTPRNRSRPLRRSWRHADPCYQSTGKLTWSPHLRSHPFRSIYLRSTNWPLPTSLEGRMNSKNCQQLGSHA